MKARICITMSREEALFLADAINTERYRVQDRACEAFVERKPDAHWLYRLGCLDSLLYVLDNEIENQFMPSMEQIEAEDRMATI